MMEQPLRVLQVVDSLGMGGAETWLMEVLRRWARDRRAQMDFLITSGQSGVFDDEARALGATLHYVRYSRRDLPTFIREFRRVLRGGRYDAIHDHQDYASGWHYLAGAGLLPPVRVTHVHNPAYQIHENYGVTAGRRLTSLIGRRLVARFATHIAGTSRQVVTEYGFDDPTFGRLPRFALHCGFDPARFAGDVGAARRSVREEFGWPVDARIVLFAGRMDISPDPDRPQNHKNSGLAVLIGLECLRLDPKIRLLFVGRASDALPVLERRIADAGGTDRFAFAGVRPDIARLMLGSDVLLFPSRAEGLGMVAVEAQAAGLPVVASSVVPAECVVDPDLVRFVDLTSPPVTWARHVIEAAGRRPNRSNANARVAASPFAIDTSSRAMLNLYRAYSPC